VPLLLEGPNLQGEKTQKAPQRDGYIRKMTDKAMSKPYCVKKGKKTGNFPSMEAAQKFLDKLHSKRRLTDIMNLTSLDIYNN